MKGFISMMMLVFVFMLIAMAQGKDGERKFVGATKCKKCHKKVDQGEQYGKWADSKHAKAYATLASDESKKIAKEKGIADPQKAEECLKCHLTAYNVDKKYLGTKYSVDEGVSCESCHGAGGDYYKKKTMKAIYKKELDGAKYGLVTPDEKLCKTCHNSESPTFKDFDYEKRSKEMTHSIPEKKK